MKITLLRCLMWCTWLPALAATACAGPAARRCDTAQVQMVPDADSLARRGADSAVRALTPRQRCGMLLMPSIFARADAPTLAQLRDYALREYVGGVVLLRGDTASVRVLTDSLRRWGREDMLVAIDAEWGLGMRLSDAPVYPKSRELGRTATAQAMYDYGLSIAGQCRRLGINMVLGPVADVVPGDIRTYMSARSLGGDPDSVAMLVCAYARGLEGGGVISVAKHFPGHGAVRTDSHKSLPVIYKSLHSLEEEDLLPFRRYVEAGLSGVMIGHMAVAAVDGARRSAAVSEAVMTELLRGDLNFKGLILTDALNMGGAAGATPSEAVAAGADLVLSPARTDRALEELVGAVGRGVTDMTRVDASCRRIFYHIYKLRGL